MNFKDDRLIFHVDVNSAYLSWEAAERLALSQTDLHQDYIDIRTIPCAIGGDREKRRGIILAKSLSAKKLGVTTGESVMAALKKCPSLMLIAPNHDIYAKYSKSFVNILEEYTPTLEQFSIDEVFMDMTQTIHLFGTAIDTACQIRERIKSELGFTVNVGISTNKLLAKMASDFYKPDKTHTLFPHEISKKMWPLAVSELFSVGKSSAQRLRALGIRTIGDLAKYDKSILEHYFKKHGAQIWNYANGIDDSPVESLDEAKGYGNSTTLPKDVCDKETAHIVLLSLAESVALRLRENDVQAGTLSITIKTYDFQSFSHQTVLDNPSDITDELHKTACQLFDELWDHTPIRLLGISTSHISAADEYRQMDLFDQTDYEKLKKLDAAVDDIRSRFGRNAIKRASLLDDDRQKH